MNMKAIQTSSQTRQHCLLIKKAQYESEKVACCRSKPQKRLTLIVFWNPVEGNERDGPCLLWEARVRFPVAFTGAGALACGFFFFGSVAALLSAVAMSS